MFKKQSEKIRAYLLQHIPKHAQDIVAVTAKHFDVSRVTVHRHLQHLLKAKKIVKTGTTRQAKYFLSDSAYKVLHFTVDDELDEFVVFAEYIQDELSTIKKNVSDICEYGFTEIFNNAIEHSQAKKITVSIRWTTDMLRMQISDDGIGIFQKITNALALSNYRESILQLSKGKMTTDPKNHTGKGIFFTSRIFDRFCLFANELMYCRDNIGDDWYMQNDKELISGTCVLMEIALNSSRKIVDVFQQFQSPDTLNFDRTHILVKLSQLQGERYISRSQAKRILMGLDEFEHIMLDFKGVVIVGQGFVDEVFRVYQNKRPDLKIEYTNANEDVEFMVKRGLATAARA